MRGFVSSRLLVVFGLAAAAAAILYVCATYRSLTAVKFQRGQAIEIVPTKPPPLLPMVDRPPARARPAPDGEAVTLDQADEEEASKIKSAVLTIFAQFNAPFDVSSLNCYRGSCEGILVHKGGAQQFGRPFCDSIIFKQEIRKYGYTITQYDEIGTVNRPRERIILSRFIK